MSVLWVFGDSYGHLNQEEYNRSKDWHWISLLSKELTENKFIANCAYGAANEWIYFKFLENLQNIKKDDYVIIISTQIDRRWFFENRIGASNLSVINSETESLTYDQKKSVDGYLKYLNNPMFNPLLFHMFCNSIHYLTALHDLQLLVLPGFEESGFPISGKYNVVGSLFDICKNEIKGKSVKNWAQFIGDLHKGVDPRIGHLSPINHKILSNKLKNTFLDKDLLNLNEGFEEEII